MFKTYIKPAWRATWKNKRISAIKITGLAVGMTASILILLWVQNETSFDNYHPNAENIYRITDTLQVSKDEKWIWETTPLKLAEVIEKNIPEVEQVSNLYAANWNGLTFKFKNELFTEKNAAYIDKNWFNLFHYDFVEGGPSAFFKNPFSIILTQTKARKYFGSNPASGKILALDSINYTVQGVIKDNPANSSFHYDVLLPEEAYLADSNARKNADTWNNFNFLTFLRLNKNATAATVAKKMTNLLQSNKKDSSITIGLQPLATLHFETSLQSSSMAHANKKTVYIFSILALLLIVTACINYVNLTTARASLRVKEITIRKIVGAQRLQLFIQFIVESVLISLISLCITLVLAKLSLPYFNSLTEKHFELSFTSPSLWKVLGSTLLFITLLNSIYPATLLSSFNPLNIFRGINTLRIKDSTLRKGLVVFQFTLSVVLIISTIVVSRQLHYIQTTNPGYQRAQIIALQVPYKSHSKLSAEQRRSLINTLMQQLQKSSSIAGVTAANQLIVNITSKSSGSADWDGRPSDFDPSISQLSVDADFQKIMGLVIKQGRWFDPSRTADSHNFIINETAAKELRLKTPVVGQRFMFQGDSGQVIGVVKDFHFQSMHEKIQPLVICNRAGWLGNIFVKTYPGSVSSALNAVQAAWSSMLPEDPFNYVFLDDSFNNLYKDDLKVSSLVLIFSVIVVIISALGLFALAAFTAEQRTKEIGIRKVLGATVANITLLLSKDFIKLVLIAIVIASPIAWWAMHKWLQDFAYRISISWWMFGAAGLAALFIAAATISFQAIKAGLSNPVKSLRTE
ncbi:MAG TPA: ABC transporter permease [Chitinophagaceae bacterium]|nr:ABC transporter permease [Chitinophagaceae bacterium]